MAITYSPHDKLCLACNCVVKIKYDAGEPVSIVTVLRDNEGNETYEPHHCEGDTACKKRASETA